MPDSPTPAGGRRFWRFGVALSCVLGATGILLAAVLSRRVQENSDKSRQAVCAIINYGEDTLMGVRENPRPQTQQQREATQRFKTLVRRMRATGIYCPPPPKKK